MSQTAVRAADFVGSIGVNTHANFGWTKYANTGLVEQDIRYLGVGNVRDNLDDPSSAAKLQAIHDATGVKFDITTGVEINLAANLAAIAGLGAGVVSYVEGANEPDVYGPSLAAATQEQVALYGTIKSAMPGVGVIQTSFGGVNDYGTTGNQSAYADYGNAHTYFGTGNSPGWNNNIPYMNGLAQETTPGKSVVVSELGYYTINGADSSSVSNDAQAKYTLDAVLDAYQAGDVKTYLYELLDANTGNGNAQDNFGLFNSDGSAKPAATAVHNLISLLSDTASAGSSFGTGNLGYKLSGMPSQGNSELMQKSDGTFWLALWNDARVAGPYAGQVDNVDNVNVTLALDNSASKIEVFDPLTGTGVIQSANNTNNVTISLPDHPVLVEIIPGGVNTTTAAATTAPAVTTPTAVTPSPTTAAPTTPAPTTPAPATTSSDGTTINEANGQNQVVATINSTTINLNGANNTVFLDTTGNTVNGTSGNVTVMAFQGGSAVNLSGGNDYVRMAGTGSVIDLKGPTNQIDESGSSNTIVLEPTALDTVFGNVISNDTFDLRPLLAATNWNGDKSILSQYISVASSDNNSVVAMSATANGSAKQIALLHNTGNFDASALLAHSIT